MSEQPDPNQCGLCGETYPVPSLARDCEERHSGHPLRAQDCPALLATVIG